MPFTAIALPQTFTSGLQLPHLKRHRGFPYRFRIMTRGTGHFVTRTPKLLALLALLICAPAALALHSVDSHHRVAHSRHPLRRIRSILWYPLFRPSHDSLLRQNEEIDRLALPRIIDDAQLERLKASHELVPIEASEALKIEPSLDHSRRYCRPWTRDFVQDLSEVY